MRTLNVSTTAMVISMCLLLARPCLAPRVYCVTCGDYDSMGTVDLIDYLLLLAEYGLVDAGAEANRKGCLDLTTDGCITADDLLAWETGHSTGKWPLVMCPDRYGRVVSGVARQVNSEAASISAGGEMSAATSDSLLILGKSGDSGKNLATVLFQLDISDSSMTTKAVSGTGRLASDSRGRAYQIDPAGTIRRLDDGVAIVEPKPRMEYGDKQVSLGLHEGEGALLMDAVFDPCAADIVYVVPVKVYPKDGTSSYVAAARLNVDEQSPGDYRIEAIYGSNPKDTSNTMTTEDGALDIVYEPDLQHLNGIEIDRTGRNLFVLNSCWHDQNNWIVIYDTAGAEPNGVAVQLNDRVGGDASFGGPEAMLVSRIEDKLYLTASAQDPNDANDLAAEIYCFSIDHVDGCAVGLMPDRTVVVDFPAPDRRLCQNGYPCDEQRSVSVITAMAEGSDGTLHVTGFCAPTFLKDERWPIGGDWFFATPVLGVISPGQQSARAIQLSDPAPALPLSIMWNYDDTGE